MKLGESIKYHRTKCGLTQKDLSEKLNVSFQTVSKWENDTNEPDLATVKALCNIFKCSVDELIDFQGEPNKEVAVVEPVPAPIEEEVKEQIGVCCRCGKGILKGEKLYKASKENPDGTKTELFMCDECFQDEKSKKSSGGTADLNYDKKLEQINKRGRGSHKVLGWSIFGGIVAFVASLITCIINYQILGIGWTIGLPLITTYGIFAGVYCVVGDTWVAEIFVDVATWSVKFPGLIFTFDLEGFAWLIVMKLLFFVLGIFISIAVVALAVILAMIFGSFTFPFVVGRVE